MRLSLSTSLSITVLTTLLVPTSMSWAFTDVSGNSPEAAAINSLEDRGIVQGYSDGTFRPYQNVNRAEFLKIVMIAANRKVTTNTSHFCFVDFAAGEQWYWSYACAAKEQGLIEGYPDGRFRGEQ